MRHATAIRLRKAVYASAPQAPAQVNRLRYRTLKRNWNATPSNHRASLMAAIEGAATEMGSVTTASTAAS